MGECGRIGRGGRMERKELKVSVLNTSRTPHTSHSPTPFIKNHLYPFPFPLLSGITSDRIVDRTNYEHAKIR